MVLTRTDFDSGEFGVMGKAGWAVPGALGLGHPQLHSVHGSAPLASGILGVRDAMARGHEVELPGPDQLLVAQTVGVQDFAGQQPRHGMEPDVGVGADHHGPFWGDIDGPEAIQEAPGAHGPPPPHGKGAMDRQPTDLGEVAVRDFWISVHGRVFRRPSLARFLDIF